MKTQPITQKAKGSPFKLNESLVQGAADLGASKNKVVGGKKKVSPGNNQQPAVNVSVDLTDFNSKDLDKTNEEVKKENKIVEDYKPDDVVGFFNNIFKNSKS
jgi:hypothetical protein